ncbi:hypothetical protein [Kitasatospora terrestris]|uniref:Uncharacterized protein n=1 Tax=Kitasatospora terrestris TaxID=258051 RepID=A0ABP9D8B7_9ACTN
MITAIAAAVVGAGTAGFAGWRASATRTAAQAAVRQASAAEAQAAATHAQAAAAEAQAATVARRLSSIEHDQRAARSPLFAIDDFHRSE